MLNRWLPQFEAQDLMRDGGFTSGLDDAGWLKLLLAVHDGDEDLANSINCDRIEARMNRELNQQGSQR